MRYLKNTGNHNISLKATTLSALQVTVRNEGNSTKKAFVFCQTLSSPPPVASYSLHFQIQSTNSSNDETLAQCSSVVCS